MTPDQLHTIAVQAAKLFDIRMEAGRAAREVFPPISEGDFDRPPVSDPRWAKAYDFQLAKLVREAGLWDALSQREKDRLAGPARRAAA